MYPHRDCVGFGTWFDNFKIHVRNLLTKFGQIDSGNIVNANNRVRIAH